MGQGQSAWSMALRPAEPITKKKSHVNKNNMPRAAFSTSSLHEDLYDFLLQGNVQKAVEALLDSYEATIDLYLALRRDTVVQEAPKRYRLMLDPEEPSLWLYTRGAFQRPTDKATRALVWPAGDYDTWGELYKEDEYVAKIYDTLSKGDDPFASGAAKAPPKKDQLAFASSIYICFVIPYAMARFSLAQRPTPPPAGCFNFVYRGGGAGALVGSAAYTCAHTVSYKGGDVDYRGHTAVRHQNEPHSVARDFFLRRATVSD